MPLLVPSLGVLDASPAMSGPGSAARARDRIIGGGASGPAGERRAISSILPTTSSPSSVSAHVMTRPSAPPVTTTLSSSSSNNARMPLVLATAGWRIDGARPRSSCARISLTSLLAPRSKIASLPSEVPARTRGDLPSPLTGRYTAELTPNALVSLNDASLPPHIPLVLSFLQTFKCLSPKVKNSPDFDGSGDPSLGPCLALTCAYGLTVTPHTAGTTPWIVGTLANGAWSRLFLHAHSVAVCLLSLPIDTRTSPVSSNASATNERMYPSVSATLASCAHGKSTGSLASRRDVHTHTLGLAPSWPVAKVYPSGC